MKIGSCLYIFIFIISSKTVVADSNLKVLVTIKPFHSLVSAVMEGVSEPLLLLKGNDSPHSYSLKPSSAKVLQESDIVFWGGRAIEGFLFKTFSVLVKPDKLVSLLGIDGINLLEFRDFTKFSNHQVFSTNEKLKFDNNINIRFDPHIWLDPYNAKTILNGIVQILSKLDPNNAKTYIKNGEKYKLLLDKLDKMLSLKIIEVSSVPFLVLHDAFQYLEWRYGLKNVGVFEINKSFGMSIKRMTKIREKIKKEKIVCVFSEPNISQKLLKTAVEGTNTRIGILDPLGVNINKGPELYFTLLTNLVVSLRKCLK